MEPVIITIIFIIAINILSDLRLSQKLGHFHLNKHGLAGQKELVLASFNAKVQGIFIHFLGHHNFPNPCILANWENWTTLIHEQGHSGQNQFWDLVRSI